MKKGLSVLLIAAALFGFYGGATNLNDVLACKDYFESASGASDDMQRLEDGLNQLKDNEQAYLDGQVALAEGEKTLADGKAQYAEGLAAYKAAPGQLADGEKALKDLAKLIKGLKTAQKHGVSSTGKHDKYWHDAFSTQLKPGRQLIVKTLQDQKDMVGMLESLTGASGLVDAAANAGSYPAFDNALTKKLIPTFEGAATALNGFAAMAEEKGTSLSGAAQLVSLLGSNGDPDGANALAYLESLGDAGAQGAALLKQIKAGLIAKYGEASGTAVFSGATGLKATDLIKSTVKDQMAEFVESYGPKLSGIEAFAPLFANIQTLATKGDVLPNANFSALASGVGEGLSVDAKKTLEDYAKTAQGSADQFKQWDKGYQTLAHAKDGKTSKKYPDDLASKKSGVPFAFKNMVTNKTIKAAIKKYDPSLMKVLKKYTGNRLKNDSMDAFDKDIVYLGDKVIPRALKVLGKVKAEGQQTLAEGYKSYKEAPAKLADAEKQLADGEKQLADGKAQLAQYEDGEQQVRDGLATLVGTQPMGDVQGIADRIGNDTDFDNGDEHLELDEGLSAVQAGKGYASDLTAAVTDEIMSRAIATGLLIGAGVLAVLAALLSFLKKNKGAGVLAVLAAAAGCVGAFMGNAAGMQFSSIAGSTMGATPWVAAGILAAVAAVHAIVHFTAKKEA